MGEPLVSIIIVHYGDAAYLRQCAQSIQRSGSAALEVIIVDNNGATRRSLTLADADLPEMSGVVLRNERNLGFAEGCNQGVRAARGRYVFILNNDIELDPGCLTRLVATAEADPDIGILQPKMLDFSRRELFHSSAGGGLLDVLGYPFARGRLFGTVEADRGQYNDPIEIFWAGGAALFARRDVLVEAGLFDPEFFLYMEEIDLAWRVQLRGHKVVYAPQAVIYHFGCPNLGRADYWRMYYVHRNSLLMLLKNLSMPWLVAILPARLALELGTAVVCLLSGRPARAQAITRALGYLLTHLGATWGKRRAVQRGRRIPDRMLRGRLYRGSVAFNHYVRRVRRAVDLPGLHLVTYIPRTREGEGCACRPDAAGRGAAGPCESVTVIEGAP